MDAFEIVDAIIMGIVEGLTEFLPVSSTAHLILLGKALGFSDPSGSFKVMIQLGAILAVITLYSQKILATLVGLPREPKARRFALGLVIAFLPAVGAGVLLADTIERLFLEGEASAAAARIIATMLILGGLVMLLVERFRPAPTSFSADDLPLWKSFAIGVCQCMALAPGVSRSGATIIGAMLFGLERRAAAEFSFFLAMPTMVGAFGYSFWKNRDQLDFSQLGAIGVGFVAAFLSALLVVRLFLEVVSRVGFTPFALYRIGLGLLILAAVSAGYFT